MATVFSKKDFSFSCIYKLTSPSGKIYIGQAQNMRERFRNYRRPRASQYLLHAIQKYGLENNHQEIIIGSFEESSFSIDQSSSVIFDILRSKMYSNKIGAVAREIASNSRDANREAKTDKNIEIEFTNDNFLSTIGDTSIIFRDYGIGISPDRMETIFLKYAASTKRDSDLQTGGFGIGSKTPFCYTDSFVIKTINEGVDNGK